MEFPVRCFTCGSVIGDKYEDYKRLLSQGPDKALDQIGVTKYCCRRMFVSHVDSVDSVRRYNK
ncbi:DNA-directed RNA polymerase subunit N [Candidatus Micrarchaeota archaeon]|nr:DNA-directed RNA polymerase subunit N [Candidatus Micrarchaeota archaeon]